MRGFVGAALVLLGAASPAAALEARFSWAGIAACGSTSPAFTLKGVPKGTAQLRFTMRDDNAPDFRHGGGTIAYAGQPKVAQGAIGYIGPCPPVGEKHTYVWTVESLDAAGAVTAKATASGVFPP